jgi:DNA helicase-2/ATP-dependent DNA helicase PcrA
LGRLLEQVLDASGYMQMLRAEPAEESQERIGNIQALVSALDEYMTLTSSPSLPGFLEEVALASDIDRWDTTVSAVRLMTLHAAKGLEFNTVFMPGMEEGLFPHGRSVGEPPALEEERRLCYVGLTRARKQVFLSMAQMRTVFGQTQWNAESRFVGEIPDDLLEQTHVETARDTCKSFTAHDAVLDKINAIGTKHKTSGKGVFSVGLPVFHATFGEGKVLKTEGSGSEEKLTVHFPSVGHKTVLARFVEKI